MKKSTLLLFTLIVCFTTPKAYSQAPAQCHDVMLQGFYWDSYIVTNWTNLNSQSAEIGAFFDLIWLPPSSRSSGGTGYMPKEWNNQSSAWGTQVQLKTLIQSLHNNNCKAIADIVVNHRDGNLDWCHFAADNFGSFGSFQLGPEHICYNDESRYNAPVGCNNPTGAYDEGENFDGCRDLDHTQPYVQNAIKAYLKWLKAEIGYDGWRYDMVKGFKGERVGTYNDAAAAYLSVGEYWDGSYNAVWDWINATGKKSTAFDFPGKYAALNQALQNNNYNGMVWMDGSTKRPAGLVHSPSARRYAVTFIDNHDTYRDQSKYNGDVCKAYAFILSAPGIPCVFYPHWTQHKNAIKAMITARKAAGLHSESDVSCETNSNYYKATSVGTNGKLITFIGGNWTAPSGYTLVTSGNGYAMYLSDNASPPPTDPNDPPIINTEGACVCPDEKTVFFSKPIEWGNSISAYIYDESTNPITYISLPWPGEAMAQVGDGVYKYVYRGNPTATWNIIFHDGNGNQTPVYGQGGFPVTQSMMYNIAGAASVVTTVCQTCDNIVETETFCVDENTNAIYFQKPSHWATANIWYWEENGEADVNLCINPWPGDAMTLIDAESNLYQFTFTTAPAANWAVLFNGGSDQHKTADLTLTNCGFYTIDGFFDIVPACEDTLPALPVSDACVEEGRHSVFFYKPASWGNFVPNVYVFYMTSPTVSVDVTNAYPGNAMTLVDIETGLYRYDFASVPTTDWKIKFDCSCTYVTEGEGAPYYSCMELPAGFGQQWNFSDNAFYSEVGYISPVPLCSASSIKETDNIVPKINFYPNPASDFIFVINDNSSSKVAIEVFDINGKQFITNYYHLSPFITKINVTDLPAGIFFLKIGNSVTKFVKK
ncbi:MAG: starch-binding protein [Bacteroidales bacterium]|nr:starch-binding protein [Bacteroidales bacterium]